MAVPVDGDACCEWDKKHEKYQPEDPRHCPGGPSRHGEGRAKQGNAEKQQDHPRNHRNPEGRAKVVDQQPDRRLENLPALHPHLHHL